MILLLFFFQDFSTISQHIKEDFSVQASAGDQLLACAKPMLEKPYIAHSLESDEEEHLIVNWEGFDCTTFVETSLALRETFLTGEKNLTRFEEKLTGIRYYDGKIAGYPSRLHYFSQLKNQLKKQGKVLDLAIQWQGVPLKGPINFMSQNTKYYPKLSNPEFLEEIRKKEAEIKPDEHKYIPNEKVPYKKLRNGDIVAFVTNREGLDVSHLGLVYFKGGVPHLMHASQKVGRVLISQETLKEYTEGSKTTIGLMILRLQ